MLRPHRVFAPALLACTAALALGACKVEMNSGTANADDAKANAESDPKPMDEAGDAEGDAGSDAKDPSTTLSAGPAADASEDTAEEAVESATEGAAAGGSDTLSAGPAASCGDHKAGDTWKDDCNTCRCTDDGKAMCTRMACKPSE